MLTLRKSVVIVPDVSAFIKASFISAESNSPEEKSSVSPNNSDIEAEEASSEVVVTLSASTSPINFTPLTFPPADISPSAYILPPISPSASTSFFRVKSPPEADIF